MNTEEMIAHKTSVNKRIKEIRKRIKPIKCPLCKRPLGKTCNSHSVPRMILNTISKDGYLYNKNIVDNIAFTDSINGISKTGTFQYICRTCDNNFFADYEQPEAIHTYPSDKMLVEIAIKNLLQKMQAKAFESTFFKMDPLIIQSGLIADREDAIRTYELDYREYEWYLNKFISIKENDEVDRFKIIFRSVLNYEVSIATQECFTIYKDRDGNAINNPYLGDSERVQVVHLCVFPFEGKTTVLLFYYCEDTSYDILKQQFENSSYDINLRYINYYMLALGENYFYSGEIKKELFSDPALKKISREYIGERGNFGITSEISKRRVYTPVQYDGVPFLLDRIYSLDNM